MQWYIAKITFQIVCGDGDHMPQFDEQLRLIYAKSFEHALQKARQFGEQGEDTFLNNNGQLVKWKFINVVNLYNLHSLEDGSEICSNVHEVVHSEMFIQLINNKAALLKSRYDDGVVEQF